MDSPSDGIGRRSFIGVALASGFMPAGVVGAAEGQTEAERANVRVVTAFCAAWSTRDLDKIVPYLADDSVYRMSETTPPAIGHAGVRERLGSWMESSQQIEFRILDAYAKGPLVITHRIDRFVSKTRPLTWEGVGVFFVKDTKIKEWFDYTIKVER
ncbi:MAG: limonene-1,2-epoxide hydrolase family protein [Acidobacteriota bacterium]